MSCDQANCSEVNINDIFEALCRNLSTNNEITATSEKFSALNTNAERVSFADDLLRKYKLLPKFVRRDKDDGLSAKYRQEGNEAFKKKDDLTAWNWYTKSIAHAKTNGECLGLAYANRSAVFYEKQMYKLCLEDITKAFEHNYPKNLHDKLIERQCKAKRFLSPEPTSKYYETVVSLPRPSKKIQCASACVEIRKSEVSGRQVVALDQIELGEVIAVEKPYAHLLLKKYSCDHCYFCLELCYNMLPCEGCVYAMFCSSQCRKTAWARYHRYECPILANLYALKVSSLTLIALRIAIMAKEHYKEIGNYEANINDTYKSQHYEEIHFLEANTHLRKSSDLFPKATTAAVVRNLMTDGSPFHQQLDDPKRDEAIFDELIMRHLQTGPTNFHDISECVEGNDGFLLTPEIGMGAYAFLSLFNHSCTPNVVRHCHGSQVVVRAIRPIVEGDELVDNYGYHFAVMKKTERQRELRRQYFFDCACEACENNWPLYQNLAHRGRAFDIPELQSLIKGDREKAVIVIGCLLDAYSKIAEENDRCPNKFIADMQETMKQCYAILGNRRPKF